MSRSLLLIPNFGAEEGVEERGPACAGALAVAARLWRALFAAEARFECDPQGCSAWPEALGPRPEAAVFPWLEAPGQATAWLNTEAAAARAAAAGRTLSGAAPERVRRVHDKAFAHATALAEGLVPASLRDAIQVLEAQDLLAPQAAAGLEARVAGWPAWLRRGAAGPAATLKPRLGSSGRGRVALGAGVAGPSQQTLARLAARGGALLEPWLLRRADLSAQLRVEPHGGIVLLGTLEQIVSPAGVCRGHRGTLDTKGRITSGSAWDEPLREAAAALAAAAARQGYHGPCGVDAFVFDGAAGSPELRPVVELNARFTLGTLAIGSVRRVLRPLKRHFALRASERLTFYLGLDAPPAGWPTCERQDILVLPLWQQDEALRPALAVAREAALLGDALGLA